MKISHPVFGSNKMSNMEYWLMGIRQGCYEFRYAIETWLDLITGQHDKYWVFDDESSFDSCRACFWDSLNEQVYDKQFIEELYQIVEDVESGKMQVFDENFWEEVEREMTGAFENLMNIFQEDSLDE
jgi:hypothetical protein